MNRAVPSSGIDLYFDIVPFILAALAVLNLFMIRRRGISAVYLVLACLALGAGVLVWRKADLATLGGGLAALAVVFLALDVMNRKDRSRER